MKLVNIESKSFEDVPDDQAQAALATGKYGFESADTAVPVRSPDGQIGTVQAKDYEAARAAGAELVSHEEYHKADLEARRGGLGDTLAAAGEGLARGLTVGLSDPLAVGAARAFGGEEAAQKTRTHLAEEKEAHPIASTGTEILGAALPAIASGGATAPEEGAALAAEGGGRMAALLRAIGAPARAVAAAGEGAGGIAERAMTAVFDEPGASGAMARIARAAIKSGAQASAEGALFGAGQEVSEDVLGDHDLNAEKVVAAMGHGAIWGAVAGAGVGGGVRAAQETIGPLLSRVAPKLDRAANEQAARAFDVKLNVARKAEARAGGALELGATARKYDIVPNSPLEAAKIGPEELLQRTRTAMDQVGSQIGAILEGSSATVKASEILAPLDERIAALQKTAAGRQTAESLVSFRRTLADTLGVPAEGATALEMPARVERTPQAMQQYIAEHPEVMRTPEWEEALRRNQMPDSVRYEPVPEGAKAPPMAADPDVPIKHLIAERRALQARLKWPVQEGGDAGHELRQFSGQLNELEETAINRASHTLGEAQGTALRAANKDMQRLYLLEEAAERKLAAHTALRKLSPTSYLAGIGGAAMGHGSVLGALQGVGAALGHQVVHDRGNAVASAVLGRLARLDLIVRAGERVDAEIEGAAKAFVSRDTSRSPKIRLRHFASAPETDQELDDRHAAMGAAPPQVTPAHVESALPGIHAHAPKTAAALALVAGKGAAYVAQAMAPPSGQPTLLRPQPRPDEQAMSRELRIRGAVEDPVGTFARALETGKVNADEIGAIKATKPKLYTQMQQVLAQQIAQHRDSLDYHKVVTASAILGVPLDPSLRNVAALQQTYAASAQQAAPQQPGRAKAPAAPKRQLTGIAEQSSLTGQHLAVQ